MTGDTIRVVRKIRGISQSQLAKKVGILQAQLSLIESGKKIATDEQEKALLVALNINKEQAEKLGDLAESLAMAKKLKATCWEQIRNVL